MLTIKLLSFILNNVNRKWWLLWHNSLWIMKHWKNFSKGSSDTNYLEIIRGSPN